MNSENEMKVYVVSHKKFSLPKDPLYQAISVGGKNIEVAGSVSDSTYDNISILNEKYCELTALYWIWKNSKSKIIGLNHYRRYFNYKNKLLSSEDAEVLTKKFDIIIPKRRNYYIFTIWSHYKNAHYEKDLFLLKEIISTDYPDYLDSFSKVMGSRKLSLYNMFIGKKDLIDSYCQFLFPVLDKLNKSIDATHYDSYQKRVIGFLAERLFNVWIYKNRKNFRIKYLKVINTEGEPVFKKGIALLKRQFT